MREQLQRHQGKATWSSVAMVLVLLGSEVTDIIKDRDSVQDNTSTSIMSVVGEKYAAFTEWKDNATEDIRVLQAENKKLMGEVAALSAVVKLLSSGNRREAAPLAAIVHESVTAPTQPMPALVGDSPGSYEFLEVTVEKPSPRAKAKTVIRKRRRNHDIKSARKIEITQEQIQKQVEELF